MVALAEIVNVNNWAVLVSAAAMFVVGAVWYSPPLFGKQWQKMILDSTKLKAAEMKKNAMGALPGSGFCYLVMAYVLAYINGLLGVASATEGLVVAAWIGLGFVVTLNLSTALYRGTRKKLWAIDTGYTLIGLLLMGAILGAWR